MENGNRFFQVGTPQCGFLMGLCGVAIAFLLLFAGFWKTLLVVVLFALGFVLGSRTNKLEAMKTVINRLFPPKGE